MRLRLCLTLQSAPVRSEQAGNTPLHNAAYEGWLEGITFLIEKGAKVNATNNVRARACARGVRRGASRGCSSSLCPFAPTVARRAQNAGGRHAVALGGLHV